MRLGVYGFRVLGFRGLGFSLPVWIVLTLLYQIPGFRLEGPGF